MTKAKKWKIGIIVFLGLFATVLIAIGEGRFWKYQQNYIPDGTYQMVKYETPWGKHKELIDNMPEYENGDLFLKDFMDVKDMKAQYYSYSVGDGELDVDLLEHDEKLPQTFDPRGVAWYIYDDITPDVGMAYLTQMRFASVQAADYYPATSLGGFTTGMTTEEMAGAYAALSDRGQYREPTCIIKMINNQGEDIFEDYESVQVYQESSAVLMTDILKGVVTKGTAASMGWSGNIEAAGKTGTTNGSRDGWFCGMTPYYTMTVWVGYDQQKTLSSLYGGTYPAKIWKNAMEKMVEGLPAASFDTPETDNGRGEGTYLAGHPDAFEITTSGYTAANFRRDHLLSDEVAKLLESAKSGDSGRSSKELKEDASAKIEQIKSESIKERMQRIYKTGTAGKRYSAPAVVPETTAETVEDPAESSTTIVPAGPGSDIGPGHGPAQEPAVGPAAEIGQ